MKRDISGNIACLEPKILIFAVLPKQLRTYKYKRKKIL